MNAIDDDSVPFEIAREAPDRYRIVDDSLGDVSSTVILAVSEILDRDVTELEPLDDVVNPDALDELFAPKPDGSERAGGRLEFAFDGCTVTVSSGGEIFITVPE